MNNQILLRKVITLLAFVLISLTPGFLGAYFATANIPKWYVTLDKPPVLTSE